MTALAVLLDEDQAAALARLALDLATAPPPPGKPNVVEEEVLMTAKPAICRECGQLRPVPAAVFREPRCP